ncbi:MAG: glycosyltransferase family 4 protein [Rhodocyclaceae bacterium]|nr:glycosyltransferase family 4 protein [Rhodocyclaceae bacterium]
MKIAIALQQDVPYGGAERCVARGRDGLRAKGAEGVEVTIIAREWSGDDAGVLKVDPFYLGRTWRDVGFAHHVQRLIAAGRFDLVQSHERIPGCHVFCAGDGVHATWLELRDRARGGLARLLTNRSPWHSYVKQAEDAMFRHADLRAVICTSDLVKDDIARRFGVAPEKLHVIRDGVDLDRFHPGLRDEHRARVREELGIAADAPLILLVGSDFERKGVPNLLRALATMANQEAQLVVVGRDRRQVAVEKLARKLGIETRVRFLGGREDVRPYYGAADVFCLPSLYDPMPNAALEALACGLPVVTSTTSGAAELIEAGRNGVVCDAFDDAALARALDELCRPGAAAAMREASRAAVSALGTAAMTDLLAALYRSLAAD